MHAFAFPVVWFIYLTCREKIDIRQHLKVNKIMGILFLSMSFEFCGFTGLRQVFTRIFNISGHMLLSY
jgi:hypothetical protein